jgi:hypothetical protein
VEEEDKEAQNLSNAGQNQRMEVSDEDKGKFCLIC